MTDFFGLAVGIILTLLVFSYLLGDTLLFRVAQAIFVGVAIGYGASVAVYKILGDYLFGPMFNGQWVRAVSLLLGLLLLLKLKTSWSTFGNVSMAYLFGVGSALAIGGAVQGALLPQLSATVVSLSPLQNWDVLLSNLVLVVGTIGAFLSFRFIRGGERPAARLLENLGRGWGSIGRVFIFIAFGAIFAGTAVSRISVLISRVYYLLDALK